jgi:predicted TIM-barrel fold metal-dependent hydrolase
MDAVRKIRRFHDEYGIVAVSSFPAGCMTAINDAPYYPIYATCVELGLPIFLRRRARAPGAARSPEGRALDEVCWFFPELTVVMRHGAEPWTELAVKLMLKWPNLYYSTSAFAPKHYPEGDHRLRQHPRRRQDHLRRLLPRRADLRAHHVELPNVPLQGRGVAQVPARERQGARPRELTDRESGRAPR